MTRVDGRWELGGVGDEGDGRVGGDGEEGLTRLLTKLIILPHPPHLFNFLITQ